METRKQLTELVNLYEAKGIGLEQLLDKIEALYNKEEDSSLEARRNAFIEEVRPHLSDYSKEMLNQFSNYWLERGVRDKKFRFEKQPSFEVSKRLIVWYKRSQKYSIVNMLNKNK